MPGIDSYSLDSYGLDVNQDEVQVVSPSISQNITVNPGFTGNLINISTFPSAKLISVAALSSGGGRIYFSAPSSVTCAIALIDSSGELWQISPSGMSSAAAFSVQIFSSSATTIYSSGDGYLNSSSKLAAGFTKPANFNMSAPINLCIYVLSNSLSSASSVSVSVSSTRIVSV